MSNGRDKYSQRSFDFVFFLGVLTDCRYQAPTKDDYPCQGGRRSWHDHRRLDSATGTSELVSRPSYSRLLYSLPRYSHCPISGLQDKEDMVIDGGNEWYELTEARTKKMMDLGFQWVFSQIIIPKMFFQLYGNGSEWWWGRSSSRPCPDAWWFTGWLCYIETHRWESRSPSEEYEKKVFIDNKVSHESFYLNKSQLWHSHTIIGWFYYTIIILSFL